MEISEATNRQEQMDVALSVAEYVLSKSPSLRKVSVKQREETKTGLFSEPSLMITSSGEDCKEDDNGHDKDCRWTKKMFKLFRSSKKN